MTKVMKHFWLFGVAFLFVTLHHPTTKGQNPYERKEPYLILPNFYYNYPTEIFLPKFKDLDHDQAVDEAAFVVSKFAEFEAGMKNSGGILGNDGYGPAVAHQRLHGVHPYGARTTLDGYFYEAATKVLQKKYSLTKDQVVHGMLHVDIKAGKMFDATKSCLSYYQVLCRESKYRTMDGSCNNLQYPVWGKSFTCFNRLLPPAYADGISVPRRARNGQKLPPARLISSVFHADRHRPALYFTHMVMAWGQLMTHETGLTPQSTTQYGDKIQCCPPRPGHHPECMPIPIAADDYFYGRFNTTCMNFVRSHICPVCSYGPRNQMNQNTAFVDASSLYGSTDDDNMILRQLAGHGKLLGERGPNGKYMLPQSVDPSNDHCSRPSENLFCYNSGDQRTNQHPLIATMHLVLLRQHNRLAEGLEKINPHWSGEKVFLETRRIVSAQMQAITYGEFLPVVLSTPYMRYFDLGVLPKGYTKYDPKNNPSIYNEFATAAFRFGHTIVYGKITGVEYSGKQYTIQFKDYYFHPFGLREGQMDSLLVGLTIQPSQSFDRHVTTDVTNYLYRKREVPHGLDLASLNNMRSRDHGLRAYTDYLRFCFHSNISSFKDLEPFVQPEYIRLLSKIYESVDDIDLWTGIISEYVVANGIVGPTASCIMGLQFHNLKFGDRYYFEHGSEIGSFTPAQLRELRITMLGKIVCETGDHIDFITPNVFRLPGPNNPKVPCNSLPDIDLLHWKEPEPAY